MERQTIAELVLVALTMLIGEQGVDWQYYHTNDAYWRKWAELNRN